MNGGAGRSSEDDHDALDRTGSDPRRHPRLPRRERDVGCFSQDREAACAPIGRMAGQVPVSPRPLEGRQEADQAVPGQGDRPIIQRRRTGRIRDRRLRRPPARSFVTACTLADARCCRPSRTRPSVSSPGRPPTTPRALPPVPFLLISVLENTPDRSGLPKQEYPGIGPEWACPAGHRLPIPTEASPSLNVGMSAAFHFPVRRSPRGDHVSAVLFSLQAGAGTLRRPVAASGAMPR